MGPTARLGLDGRWLLRALLALLLVDVWLAGDVSARFAVSPATRHRLEQLMRGINSNIVCRCVGRARRSPEGL